MRNPTSYNGTDPNYHFDWTTNVSSGSAFTRSLRAAGVGPLNFTGRWKGVVVTNSGASSAVTFSDGATNLSGAYDVIVSNN